MQMVVWLGAAMALVGVALLAASGGMAMRARRIAEQDQVAAKAALSRVMFWNLGGLALAMLGLIAVIVGLILS